jgi:hypothetical protein
MAQPGIARADRSKDAGSAIAILNAGFVHDESYQVALGVGNDVAAEAAPSQTTLHRSYRFHIASHRAYNVDE